VGVVLVGMNHRTAPVELREKVAFDAESALRGLEELARRTNSAEAVILSTCNRVEVTAFHDEDAELPDAVERFLADFHGLKPGAVASHLYRLRGRDAVRHLFRVASSLDSMVPGESQILAQVKEAYLLSAEAGYTAKHLNVLFQRAFRVGKLVHTDTDIARHKVSISSVAVDLAREVLGDLADRTVLVLGAGETGKLTLRSLVESGVGRLVLSNRTRRRAAPTDSISARRTFSAAERCGSATCIDADSSSSTATYRWISWTSSQLRTGWASMAITASTSATRSPASVSPARRVTVRRSSP